MKYDDASWHYGGDFPKELPPEAGATHIGMFVAWCLLNGVGGDLHVTELPDLLEGLKAKRLTPGAFFVKACDEKFTDEDLSLDGNEFAKGYYDAKEGEYICDYEAAVGAGLPSLYHVADTWENYDRLAPVIAKRYDAWRKKG
jgi:hypothetical protein